MSKKIKSLFMSALMIAGAITTMNPSIEASAVEKGDEYILNNEVKIYMDSIAAMAGVNSVGTYNAGVFMVYNIAKNGSINITKDEFPGAWFNPETNIVPEVKEIFVDTPVYYTSLDAEKMVNAVTEYKAGVYYIYKEAPNGMINITDTLGVPGGWIYVGKATPPAPAYDYDLLNPTERYETSLDALNYKNSVGIYEAGKYFIYRVLDNGIINITKVKGQPGSWINPVAQEAPVAYELGEATERYKTAKDAENYTNSVGMYEKGKYYIYMELENGIINITKTPGEAGSWINPVPKPAPAYDYQLEEETERYGNVDDAMQYKNSVGTYPAGGYYLYTEHESGMINITKVKGQPGSWINPTPIGAVVLNVGSEFNLGVSLNTYMNHDDAYSMTNSLGKYPAGKYYIYKISDKYDSIINITTEKGIPGRWINIDEIYSGL